MTSSATIRLAVDADFPAMAQLLQASARRFITPAMSSEAGATFLRENDLAAMLAWRERGFVFRVALCGDALAGFIALRPPSHLFYLFVDEAWQRRGVARALWNAARRDAGLHGAFTVSASPYAVPAYLALGFACDGAPQWRNGVRFQPMVLRA